MHKYIINIILISLFIAIVGCRPEHNITVDPNFRLSFSQDTVRFDTIFTSFGSTTKIVKVYNRSRSDVYIDKIKMQGGEFFRVNVDGDTNLVVNKVLLRARDSMYIFIKVTIDPNDESNPFEILDKIIFEYGDVSQSVCLSAFGQNAYYHIPSPGDYVYYINSYGDTVGIPYFVVDVDKKWEIDKPHIVYGYMVVDEGDVFTLDAGTHIHFAPGAGLWVYDGGSLRVNGTYNNEVIFEGMRRDAEYKDLTGQWERIWLSQGSLDNNINYAIIKNGSIGLLIDTVANSNPALVVRNTIITNMQQYGIIAQGSVVEGENLVVSNCGTQLLALTIGGSYSFSHCTFAAYTGAELTGHSDASILLNNYYYYADEQGTTKTEYRPLTRADFTSCIIYGTLQDEVAIDLSDETTGNYSFSYCNVRTDKYKSNSGFTNCVLNQEPMFIDPIYNFMVEENSPVVAKGQPGPYGSLAFDIRNSIRPHNPTIGAYEKQ